MQMGQHNTDVMVLSAAHSLMVSDVPEIVIDAHSLSENFYNGTGNFSEDPKKSLERFGMWGGTLNVNQFMPNVTPEMLKPKDSDFIEPMFRMLSAAIVAKKYNPTEFPADILKESMPLLVGQSVNLDHETDVANAIGAVKSVEWQEAYKDEKTGIIIPAGINGIMKIDGLSNPRIARGIQMDPPSIHSNSVTVEFVWEPSHTFDDMWEFYSKLGTYTENGELIRRVVTKIISYKETSLVWHGADPFAQLIKSGKLNSPAYAGSQYYSFSEDKAAEANNPAKRISLFDFKVLSEKEIKYNTTQSNNENGAGKDNHNNQNNKTNMDKELQQMLTSLFGENLLTLSEGQEVSTELALSQIKTLVQQNKDFAEAVETKNKEIQTLTEEKTNLEKDLKSYKEAKENWDGHIQSFREETVAAYKKVSGEENVDSNILALLENEGTTMETLKALRKTYDAQLEEKFPMHCNHCGSHDVGRASSINPEEDEEKNQAPKSTRDIAQTLADRKLRGEIKK